MVTRLIARVFIFSALSCGLSGCGVTRMQLGEQEVKSEWGSVLSLANEQIEIVKKAWPAKSESESDDALEAAQTALKKSMSRWEEIPSKTDLEDGARAISQAGNAVRAKVMAQKSARAPGLEAVEAELASMEKKGRESREKYTIAARTYNDILRLYPSKWTAKALMKRPAVTFEEVDALSGTVTQASMLDKLGVARDH
jgi:hypothetical protein